MTLHTTQNSTGGISSFVSQAVSPKETFASQSPKEGPANTLSKRCAYCHPLQLSCLGWVPVYLIMAPKLLQPSYIQDCCTFGMVVIIQFGTKDLRFRVVRLKLGLDCKTAGLPDCTCHVMFLLQARLIISRNPAIVIPTLLKVTTVLAPQKVGSLETCHNHLPHASVN